MFPQSIRFFMRIERGQSIPVDLIVVVRMLRGRIALYVQFKFGDANPRTAAAKPASGKKTATKKPAKR